VDKFPKTRKEVNPKVEDKTLKELWPSFDAFQIVVVQQKETTTQNNETARLMGWIAKGLVVIGVAPNGGFAKVIVTTIALGSRPKQRLVKVRAKSETRESHFMFLGVQENVSE
jgi:hypothetical protein